jgi:hypothetical protein
LGSWRLIEVCCCSIRESILGFVVKQISAEGCHNGTMSFGPLLGATHATPYVGDGFHREGFCFNFPEFAINGTV